MPEEENLISYSLTFLVPPNSQPLQEIILNFQLIEAIVMDDRKSELKSKPAMKTSHELRRCIVYINNFDIKIHPLSSMSLKANQLLFQLGNSHLN